MIPSLRKSRPRKRKGRNQSRRRRRTLRRVLRPPSDDIQALGSWLLAFGSWLLALSLAPSILLNRALVIPNPERGGIWGAFESAQDGELSGKQILRRILRPKLKAKS